MIKESLKKFYTTYRLVVFPVVIIISSLILIVYVIYPQASELIGNFKTENQLKSKFEVLEAKAQTLESVNEDDLNNKLTLALSAFPSERDFSSVVGILQNVVSKYGYNILSLHLSNAAEESKKADSVFVIKMELAGPGTLLSNLISGIESSSRIMKLNSVEVSNTKVSDSTNIILSIGVYYRVLPKDFGNVDSPLPALSEKEEAVLATLAKVKTETPAVVTVPKGKANPFE